MEPLQKIVNLIKKTGDKAVILDKNGNPEYVIMSVNDYENLLSDNSDVWGLTEGELLDKINRDIETWKDTKEDCQGLCEESDLLPDLDEINECCLSSDFNSIPEPTNFEDFSPNLDKFNEEEEDRYYFEPVE